MNLSQPKPYTPWIASMNTAPLETPWGYWNISTNHHFSYHTNSCTYNYSIITLSSSRNKILMKKILCSNYLTIDIIRHTPPDVSINTSIWTWPNQFSILHNRQSVLQVCPPIYKKYYYCIFGRSFIYLLI